MTRRGQAKLYIDDDYVGDVVLQGMEDSWSHGEFQPGPAFAKFAPLFVRWSAVMHAGGAYEPISEAASTELRRVEYGLDRLRSALHFEDTGRWVRCAQLNIDRPMIE